MLHEVNINETTTLCLTKEEEWRQATSEYHDIGYIKNTLSGTEEKPVETKELRSKGGVKPF